MSDPAHPDPLPEPAGSDGFRTFIIKTANRCNIDCDYCYVFHPADQPTRNPPTRNPPTRNLPARLNPHTAAVAARRIAEHTIAHRIAVVDIVFHGGEPLLVGVDHFTRLLRVFTDALAPTATRVRFAVQTNATLITPGWLEVFERFGVTVGVSLDGPPAANDRHRRTTTGRSTIARTERGIELLRTRPGMFAGVLAVVDLANDPAAVHDHLASFHPPVIDFNLPHATHDVPPPRTDPRIPEYGQWLGTVFDTWITAAGQRHSIRILEDIIALDSGVRTSVESLGLNPPSIIVVETDGGISNIDTLRTVNADAANLNLTVAEHTFDDAWTHPDLQLRHGGLDVLADECQRCPVVTVCGAGLLPHRFSTARGYRNPSTYCADLRYLINHVQQTWYRWRAAHVADPPTPRSPLESSYEPAPTEKRTAAWA